MTPDEVITQVAEKTVQELTGSETGKIKFEDFAKLYYTAILLENTLCTYR